MKIRIHEPGQKMSDPSLAQTLSTRTPKAFRKAQDVLVAAEKYRRGSGGWFSSEKSRRRALERELLALSHALVEERYFATSARLREDNTKTGMVVDFLCHFSDAFPNWQKEYAVINEVLAR